MVREFTVLIEQDEDGIYVASVPELTGCHTQAPTLDKLNLRIKEAIELYLETYSEENTEHHLDFIGIQKVKVGVWMKEIKTLPAKKVIKALEMLGFKKIRQKGSHIFLKHPDGMTTIVPMHAHEDIGKHMRI